MAWSPLGGGRLLGQDPVAKRLAVKLKALAQAHQVDEAAIAIAWLLQHPAKVVPVMGSNDLDRIRAFHQATEVQLDRQNWFELYELAQGSEVP